MSDVRFDVIRSVDSPREMAEIAALLAASGLALERAIDTFVVGRAAGRLVACGGLDHDVVKCVAVSPQWRGESLSLRLATEVVRLAASRGRFHLFLYCPPHNRRFFKGWRFYPIVEVPDVVVLMENSPVAIRQYCDALAATRRPGRTIGGIVLNANPFTLGHRYLVERAAAACDWLHVFVVKEDASMFSYADRFSLVADGIRHVDRLTLHPGSDYIISRATFPGYFLKDTAVVDKGWAAIDLLVFREYIGPALGITHRYVGTEPFDAVTHAYNAAMKIWLEQTPSPAPPVAVVEVPRTMVDGAPIAASTVRDLLARGDFTGIGKLVPATTLHFLETEAVQHESH